VEANQLSKQFCCVNTEMLQNTPISITITFPLFPFNKVRKALWIFVEFYIAEF
jgi:hypothetical protein